MPVIEYREALNQALAEEMERDDRVFLMGEEVAEYNGAYKVSKGLLEKFGPKRVIDTPISENGFTGVGVGAAMVGLKPVIEMMTWNFSLVAIDQIISNAAKTLYMSGGQFKVPMVIRGAGGAGGKLAAQHSQSLEAIYTHIPGLKVACPATGADAKGLLKTAIRDEDPIIFIESETLYGKKFEVPEGEHLVPFGVADVVREGSDVTIIAHSRARYTAEAAIQHLTDDLKLSVELIDPRTLRPFDINTIAKSVAKTHRVVIVEEGWHWCGIGAQIAEAIYEHCFDDLDAPIARVASLDVPMPYAPNLEKVVLPSAERVIEAVKKVTYV
ncbi:MAG TPA: pyruvate dehydrogenase complex E1 component subunit beta [Planctomycetota bacterium]|nr:pyruvate dehydrogenase complex E1 component subunit beta [Planctomycetota bacterium]